MNITGPSDKLKVKTQDPRVYIMIDWLNTLRMREKTGTGWSSNLASNFRLDVAFQLYSFQCISASGPIFLGGGACSFFPRHPNTRACQSKCREMRLDLHMTESVPSPYRNTSVRYATFDSYKVFEESFQFYFIIYYTLYILPGILL
jgi:hypothetical protein